MEPVATQGSEGLSPALPLVPSQAPPEDREQQTPTHASEPSPKPPSLVLSSGILALCNWQPLGLKVQEMPPPTPPDAVSCILQAFTPDRKFFLFPHHKVKAFWRLGVREGSCLHPTRLLFP